MAENREACGKDYTIKMEARLDSVKEEARALVEESANCAAERRCHQSQAKLEAAEAKRDMGLKKAKAKLNEAKRPRKGDASSAKKSARHASACRTRIAL